MVMFSRANFSIAQPLIQKELTFAWENMGFVTGPYWSIGEQTWQLNEDGEQ